MGEFMKDSLLIWWTNDSKIWISGVLNFMCEPPCSFKTFLSVLMTQRNEFDDRLYKKKHMQAVIVVWQRLIHITGQS